MATNNVSNNLGAGEQATALLNYNPNTTTIRSKSTNIASVTRSSLGQYIVNFSPAFADANYVAVLTIDSSNPATSNYTDQSAYIDTNAAVPTTVTLNVCTYGRDAFSVYTFTENVYLNLAIFGV